MLIYDKYQLQAVRPQKERRHHPAEVLWVYRLLVRLPSWKKLDIWAWENRRFSGAFAPIAQFTARVYRLEARHRPALHVAVRSSEEAPHYPDAAPSFFNIKTLQLTDNETGDTLPLTREGASATDAGWVLGAAAAAGLISADAAAEPPAELTEALATHENRLGSQPSLTELFHEPLCGNLQRLQSLFALTDTETQILGFVTLAGTHGTVLGNLLDCFDFENHNHSPRFRDGIFRVIAGIIGTAFKRPTAEILRLLVRSSPLMKHLLVRNPADPPVTDNGLCHHLFAGPYFPLNTLSDVMDLPMTEQELTAGLFTRLPVAAETKPLSENHPYIQALRTGSTGLSIGLLRGSLKSHLPSLEAFAQYLGAPLFLLSPSPVVLRDFYDVDHTLTRTEVLIRTLTALRGHTKAVLLISEAEDILCDDSAACEALTAAVRQSPFPIVWHSDLPGLFQWLTPQTPGFHLLSHRFTF